MPRPTSLTTLQRPDLGFLAWDYNLKKSREDFIGLRLMPIFNVLEVSADYPVIPIESLLKVEDVNRAPRAEYNRGDWEFLTRSYSCREKGWEEKLDDVESRMFRRYVDAEVVAMERATDILMRAQEKRIADIVMNPDNAIGKTTLPIPWNDRTCKPKEDIKAAVDKMFWSTGLYPNTLVLSKATLDNVLLATEIKEYLKYTQPHQIDGVAAQVAMLSAYLGINQIMVGKAIVDQAGKGLDKNLVGIWPDDKMVLVTVSNGGRNLREPSFGRTFLWTRDSPSNIIVESYRDETVRSNIYRTRQFTGESVTFVGANYHIEGVAL